MRGVVDVVKLLVDSGKADLEIANTYDEKPIDVVESKELKDFITSKYPV